MTKTIFWNVDTQHDFMDPDGKLAVPGAPEIMGNLARLTAYAKEHRITVVNTRDWHTPESKEFSTTPDFITTFPPHCLEGTRGAEYVHATMPEDPHVIDWRDGGFSAHQLPKSREIVINKDAFDVFEGNRNTDEIVRMLHPARAIVYGVATNYCVDYAVQGLLDRGIQVYVVADAVKEIPNCDIKGFIDTRWKSRGVTLTTTGSIDSIVGR